MIGKLTANTPRTFQVTGRGGIPTGATAATGNVTVVGSSAGWAVYLGPSPIAKPTTSTINFTTGQVAGNGLTVALSSTGTLSATYISNADATTDLVFDVTGYFTPNTSGDTYHPMNPVRELDTRSNNGLSGKLTAATPRCFAVAGRNGVPTTAKAVTGNVTVVSPSSGWAVYLGPVSTSTPTTSAVNFTAGQVAGNNLTAALDSSGRLCATYMGTSGAKTDLVFDVTGYYTADASGASFVPVTPARLLDSRNGTGLTGKFPANTPRTFSVASRGGVPASASGVTGNVTVVNETAGWAVFLGPAATTAPTTSTINFVSGDVKGNGLTVALSASGTLSATYISGAGNTTDLVFDVTGYFVAGSVVNRHGTFGLTGSLTMPREGHSAVLLKDGRVLVLGGELSVASGTSTELYDPKTGVFSASGSMGSFRFGESITLLADGRVLVAGGAPSGLTGAGCPSSLASAELYDPKTGRFTPTGSMMAPRQRQSATLLPDGRVLIAGGSTSCMSYNDVSPAELYNPGTGTFSFTGAMAEPRDQQTATLLTDGRVLIAGGGKDSSAEIYNPVSGTFSATGSMGASPTWGQTATKLSDGRVLIVGGWDMFTGPLAFAEVFDPVGGKFSPTASMGIPRSDHTATLLADGRVLVAGGDTVDHLGKISNLASALLYDPKTGTFTATGSMNVAREGATATWLTDGRVLVAGGGDGSTGFDSAELYVP